MPRKLEERELEISRIVGLNIRAQRILHSMSQSALAEQLGLTFQQVQKYETGANRIAAPNLVMLAEIFNTPVETFFANVGLPEKSANTPLFSKTGIRAAQLVDALPADMQAMALRLLQSLREKDAA